MLQKQLINLSKFLLRCAEGWTNTLKLVKYHNAQTKNCWDNRKCSILVHISGQW